MTILQSDAPANVTINELTTVASAFTAARFIIGEAISEIRWACTSPPATRPTSSTR